MTSGRASEKMDINEWTEYKCKSGQTLFIKVVGGHKWPIGSRCDGFLEEFKSYSSVGTQTDDYGCQNGCTSIHADTDSPNMKENLTDIDDIYSLERESVLPNSNSNVFSEQTSTNTYASELSAVLKVLEEEFDSSTDEHGVQSSLPDNENAVEVPSSCVANKNEKEVVELRFPVSEERGELVQLQTDEGIALPSMVENRTETSLIKRDSSEKKTEEIVIENGLIVQPKQVLNLNEQFQCMKCKEVLNCKAAYNEHLLKHSRHKCPQCDKEYSYKFYLNYHLLTHTKDNKPISCSFCDKQFKNKEEHDVHVKQHVGERPYNCTVCDKRFKTRSNFKAHHQRNHTEGRKYKCSYCAQSFQRSDHLHRHLRKHTGEKPHKCIFCGKGFGRKDNLTCHLRVHMK